MARRVHYGFEKRQRELKKQKKNEKKLERRRLEKEASLPEGQGEDAPDEAPLGSERPDRP